MCVNSREQQPNENNILYPICGRFATTETVSFDSAKTQLRSYRTSLFKSDETNLTHCDWTVKYFLPLQMSLSQYQNYVFLKFSYYIVEIFWKNISQTGLTISYERKCTEKKNPRNQKRACIIHFMLSTQRKSDHQRIPQKLRDVGREYNTVALIKFQFSLVNIHSYYRNRLQ